MTEKSLCPHNIQWFAIGKWCVNSVITGTAFQPLASEGMKLDAAVNVDVGNGM